MGLHEYNTMNQVIDNLRELKKRYHRYGEGWKMFNGTPSLQIF